MMRRCPRTAPAVFDGEIEMPDFNYYFFAFFALKINILFLSIYIYLSIHLLQISI